MAIAHSIDLTLLKPATTHKQISNLCNEARAYGFASVCVNPYWVSACFSNLHGTPDVCSVVGFPLGATTSYCKSGEAVQALVNGAREIDMVINIGALKSCPKAAEEDIRMVRRATENAILKVIIETALLTRREKILACKIAQNEGADFVKTSTGFGAGGATIEDVRLMRKIVGLDMGVKASGGIETYAKALKMLGAGATRLGCSAGVKIAREEKLLLLKKE